MHYRNILTAISHLDDKSATLKTTKKIADKFGAKVTILHAFKQLSSYGLSYSLPSFVDIENEQYQIAECKLEKIANKKEYSQYHSSIAVGSPKEVILNHARKLGADLIIIGKKKNTTTRTTAELLLGSVPCDLLVVNTD